MTGYAPRRPNTAGLVTASIGAAAAIIGGLQPWYDGGGNAIHVVDIVHSLGVADVHHNAQNWLGWELWTVLALAAAAALFANIPGPLSTPLRVIGPILAGFGALGTLVALDGLLGSDASVTDHSQAGLWLVLLGLVTVGIAALLGPSRAPALIYPPAYPPPYPPAY